MWRAVARGDKAAAAGALRPLRDPNAPELDEDEDESVGSE